MADKKKAALAHLPQPPIAQVTIRSPGIDVPIEAPHKLSAVLAAEFEFLAEEGVGRYKQEDAKDVVELAWVGIERQKAREVGDFDKWKHLNNQHLKLREKLGCLPPQRFSQSSRQRGAEHRTIGGEAKSAARAIWQHQTGKLPGPVVNLEDDSQ